PGSCGMAADVTLRVREPNRSARRSQPPPPGMMAHERKSVFSCGWGDLRRGGAVPSGADFYGVDRHHRRLVDTDVGELDGPRCRGWLRSSGVETERATVGRWVVSHGPGLATTHGVRARRDRLTNAWPSRLARCLPMHSEYKESPRRAGASSSL